MKKIILFFYSILAMVYCSGENKPRLLTDVKVLKEVTFGKFNYEQVRFFSVEIGLINNSDSVISFWTETCSWQRIWISDNYALKLYVDCPSSVPITKSINPHDTITYDGILALENTDIDLENSVFKLGFVLIKENEIATFAGYSSILIEKINSKKDIFWSNMMV